MDDENEPAESKRRRIFLKELSAAGVLGTTALAGCTGGRDGNVTTTTESGVQKPTPTSDQTGGELTAGVEADITKIDPHKMSSYSSSQVMENIYQKLTKITKGLKPIGQLANDWSVSEDGLTWTFQLHEGVQFHPPVSREMTSADVVYSINRILDEDTGSPRRSNFTPVDNIRTDGDYTVIFELKTPYAPFLAKLSTGYIVPEGADESGDIDLANKPVGTGPFQWVEHQSGSHTLVERFDDYWETDGNGTQLPYLDSVRFRPIPEGSARVTAVRTGQVDWIDSVPRSQASRLENAPNLVFSNIPGTLVDNISLNLNKSPMSDEKFRKAIGWIVDRPAMVKGARFGYAEPTQTTIPPASVYKDKVTLDEPFEPDIDKATQLVEESSYDGEQVVIKAPAPYQEEVNEAEILQEAAGEAGINFKVQPTEWGTFTSDLSSGDWDIVVMGWLGFTDPDDWFYHFFYSGSKWNYQGYSNDEVDELLDKGRQETGGIEKRAEYYDKAADIIFKDCNWIPLIFNQDIMVWKPYVKGFIHIGTRTTRFKGTWLDQ